MSSHPNPPEPAWPIWAIWLLFVLLVGLLGLAAAKGASWAERQVLWWSVAFFGVFGISFLLASSWPDRHWLFRCLVWMARRQRRWYHLEIFNVGGEPRVAGWVCLAIGGLLGVLSLFS